MGAVLLVTRDKKQVAKVAVTGNIFIIGRSPQCDLPLDESLASRQHAEVVLEKNLYWVRDRGSRNGTFVNGEKIHDRRELKDGDEIGIGSTRLKFFWDRSHQNIGAPDEDATHVASFAGSGKMPPNQKVLGKSGKGPLQVKLRIIEGPLHGGVFRDWESPLTIGRGLDNHVVLLDDAVSASQAQIVQEGEQYFIVDLNSSNGTFLDGVKVQRTQLSNGQKIKIGVSTLVFELVDLRKKRRNLKIALIGTVSVVVIAALVKFLQPPDVAGQYISRAHDYEAHGDLSNALYQYSLATNLNKHAEEAKLGLARVKSEIEAVDTITMAETAAKAEDYDKAKELCYRVLRDFPKMSRALELEAVIKSIEDAKIAFTARNWGDAKRLLETAQEAYPKSELIHLRLEQAQNELAAQQNLAQANDAFQHQQLDMAQPLLQSIPTNSVYFVDAKQALDQIALKRQIVECLKKVQDLYQNGNTKESLAEIGAGLQLSASNPQLLELQKRVRQMDAMVKPLESAEALSQPDNVDALLQGQKACNDVISLETDPLNALCKRAQMAETRIAEKLQAASQADASQAADALQAGNRKDALRFYDLAVKANPNDQKIIGARDNLRQQIISDCRSLYGQGIMQEDLGQSDLARKAFKQVLTNGIPGEHYYTNAAIRLKAMGQ